MSFNHYLSGKSADVWTTMPVQLQNQLPGVAARTSSKRITAPCGFFMRAGLLLSMVGWMEEPKGSPGFLLDRYCELCSAHHHNVAVQVVFHSQVGTRL